MKRYKRLFEAKPDKQMTDFFYKRTKYHLDLVKKYLNKILNSSLIYKINPNILKREKIIHDHFKLIEPELTPYIHITWDYKCKAEGKKYKVSTEIRNDMNQATIHHIINSEHHPEYWTDRNTNLFNKNDRDKAPSEIVDATKMSVSYVACMCADWMAMAEELNNCPYEWAKKNINIRWKFTPEQEKFIYNIMDECW